MNSNCWTKTNYTRQGLSRGENRVVLKHFNGVEGRILSRTKNGWLRVEILPVDPYLPVHVDVRAGDIIKIRNSPFTLTKPFEYKVFGTTQMSQWGGRNQVSQAWWIPLPMASASKESEEKGAGASVGALLETMREACIEEASDSSDGWETFSDSSFYAQGELISHSKQHGARAIEARRRTEAEDEHFKNRTGCYSWGPQGDMGPRWGSSYTGD